MTSMDVSDSVPTSEAAGGDVSSENTENPTMLAFEELHANMKTFLDSAKTMETEMRGLKKQLKKALKKRRRTSGTPSNLMKPVKLGDALCKFLGKDKGTEMTRGAVTSAVNKYAIEAGIKKEGNGRIIVVNKPLGKLLGLGEGEEVQIFHVQTYLKKMNHYTA